MPVSPEGLSPRAKALYTKVKDFIQKEIKPAETEIMEFYKQEQNRWKVCPTVSRLKVNTCI
jgi:hypothetical protein